MGRSFFSRFLLSFSFFAMLPLLCGTPSSGNRDTDSLTDVAMPAVLEHGEATAYNATAIEIAANAAVELMSGQFELAESHFQQALAKDPTEIAAIWGLALCRSSRGDMQQAADTFARISAIEPRNGRVLTMRAYMALYFDNLPDAIEFASAALNAGENSPLLMSIFAQLHLRSGNGEKALEFAAQAARAFQHSDLSQAQAIPALKVNNSLTENAFAQPINPLAIASSPTPQFASLEFADLPRQQSLNIKLPSEQPLGNAQSLAISYQGEETIRFITVRIDGIMRDLLSAPPCRLALNTTLLSPGEHVLLLRAYDIRGKLVDSSTQRIKTKQDIVASSRENSTLQQELRSRIMTITMPEPERLSLYSALGDWLLQAGEIPQAVDSLERAAALDPYNLRISNILQKLYRENSPPQFSASGEFKEGTPSRNEIALTFDDGPKPIYLPIILSELAQYNARATFFLVGKMVQQHPELARSIIADGHELANHSYSHPNVTKLNSAQLMREVLLCRSAIKDATGRDTQLFRPPGGNIDAAVVKQLRTYNYQIAYWSLNAGEYRKMSATAQANALLERIRPGSIVLLHCGPVDGTMEILPELLAGIAKRGLRCVTVSQLMREVPAVAPPPVATAK